MKTILRDVLRDCHQRGIVLSVSKGEIVGNGPKGKITQAIKDAVLEWKPELLVLFTVHPREEIPSSFFERPCNKCGRYGDVRKRKDGTWLDACYFDAKYGLNPVHWRKAQQEELHEQSA